MDYNNFEYAQKNHFLARTPINDESSNSYRNLASSTSQKVSHTSDMFDKKLGHNTTPLNQRDGLVKNYLHEVTRNLSPMIAKDPIILKILAKKYDGNKNYSGNKFNEDHTSHHMRKEAAINTRHMRNDAVVNKIKPSEYSFNSNEFFESRIDQKNINTEDTYLKHHMAYNQKHYGYQEDRRYTLSSYRENPRFTNIPEFGKNSVNISEYIKSHRNLNPSDDQQQTPKRNHHDAVARVNNLLLIY